MGCIYDVARLGVVGCEAAMQADGPAGGEGYIAHTLWREMDATAGIGSASDAVVEWSLTLVPWTMIGRLVDGFCFRAFLRVVHCSEIIERFFIYKLFYQQ